MEALLGVSKKDRQMQTIGGNWDSNSNSLTSLNTCNQLLRQGCVSVLYKRKKSNSLSWLEKENYVMQILRGEE